MSQVSGPRPRWRPSIAMVVAGVCIGLVSVPLIALLAVRLTSNQFIRETEKSLIQQSAIYAELYANAFSALPGAPVGLVLSDEQRQHWAQDLRPARATLNLRRDPVLPPRSDGVPVNRPVDPRYNKILDELIKIARGARPTALSGVAFLTHDGRLLNDPSAPSISDLAEVKTALAGNIGRAMRLRGDSSEIHPLASISRNTSFRIFVAYPVIDEDRVIGAVYLSRTPLNLGKFLYQERSAIVTMFGVMVALASLIGWVLTRLISRPVMGLRDAAMAVADGRKQQAETLPHYGFRELATLSESVSQMANTLTKRSQEISIYTDHVTHELKSPVTTIVGAAELLQEDDITQDNRARLLRNISSEGARMNALLERLREMTRAKSLPSGGSGKLSQMLPHVEGLQVECATNPDVVLPLPVEHGRIICLQMAQNAKSHNARKMRIAWDGRLLLFSNDGDPIDVQNIDHLSDPFFTTRRDTGGTGMGLAICKVILESHVAKLRAIPSDTGATFEIDFGS